MADTTDIIKALKYWNAERFKKLQRKLTTARNTIDKEALSIQLKPFFTDEEKQVLSEASRVLGSVKRKIEHAKEIKAREEKARDLQLADYKQQRQALLAKAFPGPESAEDARPMLVWILALSIHHESISRAYFYERKYIASDIERFDTEMAIVQSESIHRL
jgi:predicted type IV restriction endonuclease